MQNVVNPELITGGEATAAMLCTNDSLTELDVSWNKIRKDSAKELGESLARNSSLLKLNLAHNAFADLPAQFLGIALAENHSLKELDLSFNSISPTAAMVLATAFTTNGTLHLLNVAGNPLGRRGGEALITAIRRCQRPDRFLRIDFANADLDADHGGRGGGILFSSTNPGGDYALDMATPYARMIAKELYRLACTRLGCSFRSVVWTPPKPKEPTDDDNATVGSAASKKSAAKKDDKKKKKGEDDEDDEANRRVERLRGNQPLVGPDSTFC